MVTNSATRGDPVDPGRLPLNDIFSVFAEGGGYLYTSSPSTAARTTAPLAGLGMTARLHDWIDIQARYRYMGAVGMTRTTTRWAAVPALVSDISTATIELVLHSQPHRRRRWRPPWWRARRRPRAGGSDLQPEL